MGYKGKTFAECLEIIQTMRNPEKGRKVGNNLRLRLKDGCPVLRYHRTDIVIWKPNGSVVLDSGGWRTVTTKQKMNDWIPQNINVWSERKSWFIQTPAGRFTFEDGATVSRKGTASTKDWVRPQRAKKPKTIQDSFAHFAREAFGINRPTALRLIVNNA